MPNLITNYRTKDGTTDYQFYFEEQSDRTWRVYILRQPPYRGRNDSAHSTHRLSDSDGRKYICWAGAIRNLDEAKGVAALWADSTQRYISSGHTF